ncbi:unnamed protein product [Mesocestoides corti]|uniref:Protein arginine N-methyltransferase n=1 Tax=Mesocestoides corti TaxID=53468 RepID=A0A0R3U520_MESCO|nr:unnamed protein product [Mesocestoides corti]
MSTQFSDGPAFTRGDNLGPSSGTFISRLSPITGMIQWDLVSNDYDFEQEIARSAYADMLHDYNRNQRYHEAIRHVITAMKTKGQEVHVLDIGTGSGLLAMMAARAGADSVVACEAFAPVAKCARRIIAANGLKKKIKLICKHSTALEVSNDLPRKANVLVAELFDTELIGEGALETYRHAAEHLLTPDAILIPCKAKMYLQVVESPFLWSHNQIKPFGSGPIFSTGEMRSCYGCPAAFDLQVSRLQFVNDQVPSNDDNRGAVRCLLEEPIMFHEFNFPPPTSNLKLNESKRIAEVDGRKIVARYNGTAHALIVWWGLQMEPSNTIPAITTAPSRANPCSTTKDPCSSPVWRDHWMQAVYFPRKPLNLSAGQPFCIDFAHDSVSMWFDIHPFPTESLVAQNRPVCTCLAHITWPRSRFAELNDWRFRENFLKNVNHVSQQINALASESMAVVVPSDASVLPLQIYSSLRSRNFKLFHLDCSPLSARILRSIYCEAGADISVTDNVDDLLVMLENLAEKMPSPVTIYVVAEPFALAGVLPWNSIHFWYLFGRIRQQLPKYSCHLVAPTFLRIWAVAMEFEHLWKIRAPVGVDCEGFDLRLFDDMVLSASCATDAPVEPQPLWEYAGKARSEQAIVFELPLSDPPVFSQTSPAAPGSIGKIASRSITIPISSVKTNAVALWTEWLMGDGNWQAPSGPFKPIKIDQEVDWCKVGPRPGVYLFSTSLRAKLRSRGGACSLRVISDFDFYTGEPSFSFDVT